MRTFLVSAYLIASFADIAPTGCKGCGGGPTPPVYERDSDSAEDVNVDLEDKMGEESGGNSDADSDGDGDSDSDGDGDSDGDSDADSQSPFEIRIVNGADTPFYVDLSTGNNGILTCMEGDAWECDLFDPFCMQACEDVSDESSCDTGVCDVMPRMQLVDTDHPLILQSDGLLRTKNGVHCPDGGTCFDFSPMVEGDYVFTLFTFDSYTCVMEDCEIEDNIISFASPSGNQREHSIDFIAPSVGPLLFEIEE